MTEGRPALLLMDVQQGIVERYTGGGTTELLQRLARATDAAREAGALFPVC